MVMRVRLIVDVHSLPFKVRLKVLTLHPDLTPVANLEPYKIPSVDEATDRSLRDLEGISNFPKREEFQNTSPGSLWTHLFITVKQ